MVGPGKRVALTLRSNGAITQRNLPQNAGR
jgi:hypothetical protein